jgi:hypothetical protein
VLICCALALDENGIGIWFKDVDGWLWGDFRGNNNDEAVINRVVS